MRVVRDDVPRLDHDGEQNALRRPSLMGGNHLAEPRQVAYHVLEPVERTAPGVGLVGVQHRGPLAGRHGPGPRIGEQVDEDLVGPKPEQVVGDALERRLAIGGRHRADRLCGVDAERLDDRLERHARGNGARNGRGKRTAHGHHEEGCGGR